MSGRIGIVKMVGIVPRIKRMKRRTIDPLLYRFGLEIKEFSSELDHFMISERMRSKSIDLVTTAVGEFLNAAGQSTDANQLREAILTFYALAPSRPVRQSTGGCDARQWLGRRVHPRGELADRPRNQRQVRALHPIATGPERHITGDS